MFEITTENTSALSDQIFDQHVLLLIESGLVRPEVKNFRPAIVGSFYTPGITKDGYDFIEATRDPEIWRKAKGAAGQAGIWTLDFLKEILSGFAKTQLKKLTGVEV
jgi:hypothetical protein